MPDAGDAQSLIRLFCQACGQSLAFSPALVGRKARCRHCGHTFRIPSIGGAKPLVARPRGRSHVNMEVSQESQAPRGGALVGMEPPESARPPHRDSQPFSQLAPQVIQDGQPAEVSGPLLFFEGFGYLLMISALLILVFWFLNWLLALWLLLPVAAVFGPRTARKVVFLLTAGAVRI